MGFPRVSYAESGLSREDAHRAWAMVANTISEYEPVRMLCHPEDLKAADKCLSETVDKPSYASRVAAGWWQGEYALGPTT